MANRPFQCDFNPKRCVREIEMDMKPFIYNELLFN